MINTAIFFETRVPFCRGLKLLKRHGAIGCSYKLLRRWATKGIQNPFPEKNYCANQLTLEYMYVGGQPVTSVEAFERFCLRRSGERVESAVSRKKPKGKP